MTGFTIETLQSMEKLFSICDHILEENISEDNISGMPDSIGLLQKESEDYSSYLADQKNHSRSFLSRDMAALLLAEEQKIRKQTEHEFPDAGNRMQGIWINSDINEKALYVEFLTGRARQSIREALISAMKLKLLSKEVEQVNRLSANTHYESGKA